ncbi:MAG: ATP-dependent DNA ligase, partial [Jiangellaceae bacterium]
MLLVDPATTSAAIADVRARSAKISLLAACLQRAATDEIAVLTHYLAGELRQRRTGLGPAALRSIPAPAGHPTLSLLEVDTEFEQIAAMSGPGSAGARRERFRALLGRA